MLSVGSPQTDWEAGHGMSVAKTRVPRVSTERCKESLRVERRVWFRNETSGGRRIVRLGECGDTVTTGSDRIPGAES